MTAQHLSTLEVERLVILDNKGSGNRLESSNTFVEMNDDLNTTVGHLVALCIVLPSNLPQHKGR